MPPIQIDGYLTQAKLERALRQIVGVGNWRGSEVRLPTGRRRWDMSYEIGGQATVVEFDGDEHYRHTLKIKADREKDGIACKYELRVVRVPYWVQLTNETLRYYFDLDADITQDLPHGFITTEVFPASFCELGVIRFEKELDLLPIGVKRDVLKSLRDCADKHGAEYVLPKSMRNLL